MSNLKISRLSFEYEDSNRYIFKNLNLDLDTDWKLGLIGRNGRGKTTFLNLLRGKYCGTGQIQGNASFSYYPVKIQNSKNITFYELQDQVAFEQWKLERELTLMNLDPDLLWQPFNTLSGGEQTKILLALSFTDQDSFPLIDEPTNHLDETSRKQVAEYLNGHDQGYIVVSHDRDFLNQVTDHILAIENTAIHLYQGNYSTYEVTKKRRDDFDREKNKKLTEQVKKLNQEKVQFHNWAAKIEARKKLGMKTQHIINRRTRLNKGAIGHQAAKMMKKSINARNRMDKKIAEKEGMLKNIEKVPTLTMNFQADYHREILQLNDLSLQLKNSRELFKNLTLSLNNHEIIAVEGKNGSGKSTLIKYLLGITQNLIAKGSYELIENLKISCLPQEFVMYSGSLKNFAKKYHLSYEALLSNLKKMGFARADFTTRIEKMSMGQQKRVALAKSLTEPANLYLWDEPANYLDVFNQDQLIKLLKSVKPTMLLIEHDPYFITSVADQQIKLTN
ncbi:ribosomal protection-like ABC-F family protein [Lactobacillus crispatus]|uniref:ABC transporter ATP-binding protein n=1 Tax=Lactobacillus crispatus TaxID=47770 RepID=A0A2N5KX40_9LACO|nr:ATP-binding cassette domain-containing protein [Lactobacillus crispatus]KAA8788663.1 ABC-F family ATP-binding cassette domain-containing protein [Lactobacillus crispatus]KAA8788682.1 ABC-F family ATP-binding cassette domain-containing protein [Lactobacillus crispatus]MDK7321059.1 ATP-binding cassette domain-containing protein [Lactobacillus crispatus]MDK8273340.1 ATP-binding cassette domain-containing protein [Lactobacillus crispatus]MDK8569509.1 ATP-binding cassette domain-containing prote